MWWRRPRPCRWRSSWPDAPPPIETSEVRPQVSGVIKARRFVEGSDRQAGPDPLRDRPQPLPRRGRPGRRPTSPTPQADPRRRRRPRPPATSRWPTSRRSPSRTTPTPRPPRTRPPPRSPRTRPRCETAQINLRFTTVPAPISGRIGRSLVDHRRPGDRGQTNAAHHHPAAGPDLRRHPAVERRPPGAAARAVQRRRDAVARPTVQLTLEDGTDYGHARHGRVRRGRWSTRTPAR